MEPFLLVPWQDDFLSRLIEVLLTRNEQAARDGDLRHCCIVFPHRRPRRYALKLLHNDARLKKPCWTPQMLAAGEFFTRCRAWLTWEGLAPPALQVDTLDRVGLLQTCITRLHEQEPGMLDQMPVSDTQLFFPWGVRLAELMEAFYFHARPPQNITVTDERFHEFARLLLKQLGEIYALYTRELDKRGWTTPGRDASLVYEHYEAVASNLEGKQFYFAGFYTLNGAQQRLFHELWRRGQATLLLHSDPAICEPEGQPHWSCAAHVEWLRNWKTTATIVRPAAPASEQAPPESRIRYFEGFDLHSQLAALSAEIEAQPASTSTLAAVILPDASALMPLLHHLPDKTVNIAMGYPLSHTALARLIETLLQLQENKYKTGLYRWRDLMELIRHPYLKMLELEGEQPLRKVFRGLETTLRESGKYSDPRTWQSDIQNLDKVTNPEAVATLLERVINACVTCWEQVNTPGDLASALEELCSLLLEYGENLWQRFPIDAESLHRLLHSVIPGLQQSSLNATEFPPLALFAILRESLRDERIPFESESLSGMQVLGLREARLLRFRQVYVLNSTEAHFPGVRGNDPLFPDFLRRIAGLPDRRQHEQETAWAFFCLLRAANEVTLLYETGVQSTGLLEQKSIRSRFIEELLWDEEQCQGQLIKPGTPPVSTISFPMRPIPRNNRCIPYSPQVQEKISALLKQPLSPSLLDVYLHCPVQFFYQHIARLEPLAEFSEDADPKELGKLVHGVLKDFFEPYCGQALQQGTIDAAPLQNLYSERLRKKPLYSNLSRDRQILLEQTGRFRFKQYLQSMPSTTIIGLELRRETELTCSKGPFRLMGVLDRIDRRGKETIILDYKTGSVATPKLDFKGESDLLKALEAGCPADQTNADVLLDKLADAMPSVQLPCYLFLEAVYSKAPPYNAALIELRKEGKEHPLFKNNPPSSEQLHDLVHKSIPCLLAFIVDHLLTGSHFAARAGRHCQWCDYRNACERL